MFYTYVLFCKNSKTNKHKFYIGSTSDLKKRVKDHKSKSTKTTRRFDIIQLIYYESCLDKKDSIIREQQLKTGFGREYIKRRLKNYFDSRP